MQKIIKILLVVMFAVVLVMGIFQLAPDILINVGWNTVGWNTVGWNTVGWNTDYWGK